MLVLLLACAGEGVESGEDSAAAGPEPFSPECGWVTLDSDAEWLASTAVYDVAERPEGWDIRDVPEEWTIPDGWTAEDAEFVDAGAVYFVTAESRTGGEWADGYWRLLEEDGGVRIVVATKPADACRITLYPA